VLGVVRRYAKLTRVLTLDAKKLMEPRHDREKRGGACWAAVIAVGQKCCPMGVFEAKIKGLSRRSRVRLPHSAIKPNLAKRADRISLLGFMPQ
jgi:hypothetical protein